MKFYSTSDSITYQITQGDSSVSTWSLDWTPGIQASSFGATDIDTSVNNVHIMDGKVTGTATVDLTEVISRFLSQPDSSVSFMASRYDNEDNPLSAGFFPSRSGGREFIQDHKDPGLQLFHFEYTHFSGTTPSYDFGVLRNQVAPFVLSDPNRSASSTNDMQNAGTSPMMISVPIDPDGPIYDSSWSHSTQITVINPGATPDNTNNAQKFFGVYFIAYAANYGESVTNWNPMKTTWQQILDGDVVFGNDQQIEQVKAPYMLAYWDNGNTNNYVPGQSSTNTDGAWNPYLIAECNIQDFIWNPLGGYVEAVDSASMPVWDPHRGQSVTPSRQLLRNDGVWSLYALVIGEPYFSSAQKDWSAKWYKLGTYDPCKPKGVVQLRYMNQYGAIDSLWMKKEKRVTLNRSPETYKRNVSNIDYHHSTVTYQQEISYQYVLNTEILNDEQSKILAMHLLQSPQIWIYDEELIEDSVLAPFNGTRVKYNVFETLGDGPTCYGLIPVVLRDTSVQIKTRANDKIFNYTLTFESANPKMKY